MIIECKCKKYKFKIPYNEITSPGRNVVCEVCRKEWYQDFKINKFNEKNLNILDQINPSITKKNINFKKNKKEFPLLSVTIIFLLAIFIFYNLAYNYKNQILIYNPKFENFYESLEIVNELIKAYYIFLKELLSEIFNIF